MKVVAGKGGFTRQLSRQESWKAGAATRRRCFSEILRDHFHECLLQAAAWGLDAQAFRVGASKDSGLGSRRAGYQPTHSDGVDCQSNWQVSPAFPCAGGQIGYSESCGAGVSQRKRDQAQRSCRAACPGSVRDWAIFQTVRSGTWEKKNTGERDSAMSYGRERLRPRPSCYTHTGEGTVITAVVVTTSAAILLDKAPHL